MSTLSARPDLRPSTTHPVVVARGVARPAERPIGRRRLVLRVFLMVIAVALAVMTAGGLVAKVIAEGAAVQDAATRTDGIATAVAEPALGDGLPDGDPADVQRLGERLRDAIAGTGIARVKVWSEGGTIVYSDEPRLVGARFHLDGEEREALETGSTEAEVSDLDEPENRFERGAGPLLEVYRAVHTPDGTPLLFEVYYRYDDVLVSAQRIWLGFVGVIAGSLLLFLLALLPLLNGLVRSVERAREERELSLLKALDASDSERRRIAAAVHDGPVQDLIGASYRLGASAADLQGTEMAPLVQAAETAVRDSVEGLRDMLVELYPASLSDGGLAAAIADLVAGARARGAIVLLRVDDDLRLPADAERLVFRIARETVGNAVKHGGGTPVEVRVGRAEGGTELTVRDSGPGFDAEATLRNPPAGHFGMRLLQDAVLESGVAAVLTVTSSPRSGTTWRLLVD